MPKESTFNFGPSYSELRQCLTIRIIPDQINEERELFRLDMNYSGSQFLTISHPSTFIQIDDTSSTGELVETATHNKLLFSKSLCVNAPYNNIIAHFQVSLIKPVTQESRL